VVEWEAKMPSYRLHCFCQSGNAYKVALYLNCAGLDWEPVYVDFMKGETRDPKWRERVNEMGEAPVLEVAGKKLSQSGAILTWLAETTGRFAPEGEGERYETLRWILFDNHKSTSYLATYRFLRAFALQAPDPAVLSFLKTRIDGALGIVDKRLDKSPYIIGARPTIADFSLAGYMFYPVNEIGYDFKHSHPGIHAWTERIRALPGWKDPYDLLPGERIEPLR
jgi:glutathione S-transferase